MARRRPPDQIEKLLDATERVMRRNGRSGASMSMIAEEAGVALGTLYHYFTSKEALSSWAITRALDPDTELPVDVPIEPAPRWDIDSVAPLMNLPTLFPVLFSTTGTADQLREAIEEFYDTVAASRRIIDLVDSASSDNRDLADRWFGQMVRELTEAWMALLHRVQPGRRTLEEQRVAAVFILSTCTFFSRARHQDPYTGGIGDDDTIRASVIDLLVASTSGSP